MDLVVVGLGYVGLPLVIESCRAGLSVAGLDSSDAVVAELTRGRSRVDDISGEALLEAIDRGVCFTTSPSVVADTRTVILCVPTPLTSDGGPDLSAVEAACRSIGPHLRPNTLVVLESTTYPGTTAEVVRPCLEDASGLSSEEIQVAYSPERIDPGNSVFDLRNTPKIVAADDPETLERARAIYSKLVDTVVPTIGTREAESAKLLENTYRLVNIALMNELALHFHEMGIDVWEVIRLASTKPFGFHPFTPGPGVGGHCIPIDPNYLSHRVRTELGHRFRFVELAHDINSGMPEYVVRRVTALLNHHAKPVRDSSIVLLGVTYKPDVSDLRASPAEAVAEGLLRLGAHVAYHDPLIPHWDIEGVVRVDDDALMSAIAEADACVLLQSHSAYDLVEIQKLARALFDTRGIVNGEKVTRL